ncbi:hypothetical protein WJX73_006332 [Symbiochloris irregularis]|uniref:Uncharacterized protein n=1 Tax=Symbiochloris irregularis TaxID=706552 RepID=A0AAW1NWL5_9CHLO
MATRQHDLPPETPSARQRSMTALHMLEQFPPGERGSPAPQQQCPHRPGRRRRAATPPPATLPSGATKAIGAALIQTSPQAARHHQMWGLEASGAPPAAFRHWPSEAGTPNRATLHAAAAPPSAVAGRSGPNRRTGSPKR